VLINGRRVPPSANSISLNAVDLNNIPLTAVDHIEVMSDSASAIYGADAIGGVVNIILKDKVEEPEVYLHYGQADGGGAQRRAAVSLGAANDRLKSTLMLDYYETGALMGEERDLWRNQDYRRFEGLDYRVSTANPGNVYSLSGQPLPGLSSFWAAVPYGATGELSPADFRTTDGEMNLESSLSGWSITPPSRRASAYGSASYSLGEKQSIFGEILAANAELTSLHSQPSITGQVVPASNPFNPFGTAVAVDYSFADVDPISYRSDTNLLRLVGGGRGRIGQWEWEMTGLRHRENGSITAYGVLDPLRVDAASNSQDPQTALNLFSDGPAGTPELLDSLFAPPQSFSFSFSSSQFSAFIRGPVFNVDNREVELVIGGEWRHDAAGFFQSGKRVEEGRDISSVFSEARIPLLDQLSLKIAARGDDFGDGEQTINPQYGLTWRPAKDWLFRAAYGTSFRPPSLFELYMPMVQTALTIADPLRGGEVSNVTIIAGGNRDLDVVTARSFTTGFVFSPSEMPGLRLGASYWRVVMDNRIMVPAYQALLKPGSPFEGLVVRDHPSSQDVEAGQPGRLRSINLSRMNYGDLDTSGIDLDASLKVERPWGCLKLDLAVTWVDEYLSRDMNQVLPLERVGIANPTGTIPEWRIVGTVGWKWGDFGLSTTTTFTPSYQDADLTTGPVDRRLSSRTLLDVQAWMELNMEGNALFDKSTLTLGARNVSNEAAEFATAGAYFGYDVSQSELTRRFIYFRISKRFQ
jgi:iron complex outermembrane receptor protein